MAGKPQKPKSRGTTPPGTKPPKFYNGPTIAAWSETASPPTKVAKTAPKASQPVTTTAVVRRRPQRPRRTILSLITIVPLILVASLFSTVLCPPPTDVKPNSYSQAFRSSFGLGTTQPEQSELHKALCYPANVYHRDVLVPYIYPAIEDLKARAQAHPVYVHNVEPAYKALQTSADRVWNGPIKPVRTRVVKGAHRFHLNYVQPRVPYVKAKITEATAPLILRLKALYDIYVAPHVKVCRSYACAGVKHGKRTYARVMAHPATKQARRQACNVFHLGRHHGNRAYLASKPHAEWAWREGSRHTHETIIPRTKQALEVLANQVARGWAVVKAHVTQLYNQHAAEHLDPYVTKINAAVAPYNKMFHANVYQPYLLPLVATLFPGLPEKPKTFWNIISDFVPSPGANVGDRGSSFLDRTDDVKEKLQKEAEKVKEKKAEQKKAVPKKEPVKDAPKPRAQAPIQEQPKKVKTESRTDTKATAPAPTFSVNVNERADSVKPADPVTQEVSYSVSHFVSPSEEPSATPEPSTEAMSDERLAGAKAEAEATIAQLKKKIDFQGKALHARVRTECESQADQYLDLVPQLKQVGIENLDREIQRMTGGLDKLYSNSRTLTKQQVDESLRMSDEKVKKVYNQVTFGVRTKKQQFSNDKVQPAVTQAQADMQKVLGAEYEALGKKLSLIDGVSKKQWDAYHALQKDVDAWKKKFDEVPKTPSWKAMKQRVSKMETQANEAIAHFKDMYESWTEHQAILKRQAVDRIDARDAMEGEGKPVYQASVHVPKAASSSSAASSSRSAFEPPATILPIRGADDLENDSPIIRKHKEQIKKALNQASAAVSSDATRLASSASKTASSVRKEDERASILPIADENVAEQAVRKGSEFIGKAKEQVKDALNQAAGSASSAATQAASSASKTASSASQAASRVSILPVADENIAERAVRDGSQFIGKAKEQVVDAVSQANEAAGSTVSSVSKGVSSASASASKAASKTLSSASKGAASSVSSASEGKFSILPVADENLAEQAVRQGSEFIGKAKEQVVDALSQASAAASSSASSASSAEPSSTHPLQDEL